MARSLEVGRLAGYGCWLLMAFFADMALAQDTRFEVTPLIGARAGGSVELQPEGQPVQARASVGDGAIYGIAAGFRLAEDECDDCSVIEFRWMRQNTHVGFAASTTSTTPIPTPFAASFGQVGVSLDHYLMDFTHEWILPDAKTVRPFIMGTLGASRLGTGLSSNTRFTFGLGAGVKVFPTRHFGIRIHAEYLPTVMHSESQRFVCVTGAACVVAVSGGLLNQFEFAAGPVFKF